VNALKASVAAAAAVVGALSFPVASQASIAVYGGGRGEACWRAARATTVLQMNSIQDEAHWKADSINVCDDALTGEPLGLRDLAATWVNRGVLEMSRGGYAKAEDNFRQALRLLPSLAEAHINLGSAAIILHRLDEGVAETKIGIDLGSADKERAYYNLGLAYESQGRLQEAYDSYKQASELKPAWQDPKDQMARFTIQTVKLQK
jgi:tetratricopeptide (TPR) repeat protein